jgi:hypothetical protein
MAIHTGTEQLRGVAMASAGRRLVRFAAAAAISVGLLSASAQPASAASEVFKTSFSLSEFERLTGLEMTNTVDDRTFFSFFAATPSLREDGFNFFINRETGRIVFRSLSNAESHFKFGSRFTESGSSETTRFRFDWKDPHTLFIKGFGKPIPVSLN